jgi:two-component system, OmpR family, sensor histidine kinase CiaH
MFTKVRLKLTAWYLLIIMAISISFSAFIYRSVSVEFETRLGLIQRRIEQRERALPNPPPQDIVFFADLANTKQNVLLILIYTNLAILFLSAGAGYLLAGKTLRPIEDALDEQKRFVADASHEFKTPLTSLQTSIEVNLRDKKLGLKEAKETLRDNLEDIEKLKTLANSLLTLARYEKDNSNFSLEKINITKTISGVVEELEPILKHKKIGVFSTRKQFLLKADREAMKKLFTILIDNAVKYSKKNGKIRIIIKKDDGHLTITVKDNGIGISQKDLPHIFDRFFRVDPSRSNINTSGFGLGLAMAKRIVDLHGGFIKATSSLGKGTTFTIKLPTRLR